MQAIEAACTVPQPTMNKVPDSVKQAVNDHIANLCSTAGNHLNHPISIPSVSYRRSGGNAGTAHLQRNHINLNPIYLTNNYDEFFYQVIPHEVAHIVVFQCFGKVKPHGQEWQAVMQTVFERQPEVRHSMSPSEVVNKTFDYQCGCGPTTLTVRRHNKVLRGQQQYQCRRCKKILMPLGLEPVLGENSI